MRAQSRQSRFASLAAGLGLGLLIATGAQAQTPVAGQVEFSRGVGFAQTPGQTPRTLGQGLPLREGDRLTTSEGGSAIIRMEDGTRMTVRPNSELVLTQYQFRENAPDNGMLMQLVRGGFRAVTGLIAKNSPNAARIQTNTATIGIRGTDFDARVCTRDCASESARVPEAARPNAVLASAKAIQVQGEMNATDPQGQRRRVVDGGSLYPGDMIETAVGARGILVFRDESRVTLGSNTRFRVDNFVFDEKNPSEGRFLASVLRGTVRALTGLVAKANNRNVGFSTATATIGIRGTGFDASCDDAGQCSLWTWLGSIAVTPTGSTEQQVLQAGQCLTMSRTQSTPNCPAPPDLPRPDGITVPGNLFSSGTASDSDEGLYVFVRDGHIEIATATDVLHLGRGEAGFAGASGNTGRPENIPKFIDFDRMPLPTSRNPLLVGVLSDAGIRASNQCR